MIKSYTFRHFFPAYLVSFIAIIFTTLPIIWIFFISIKSKKDSFTRPPKFSFEPIIDNYVKTINNEFFRETFFNSLLITAFGITLSIVIAIFAAYALKRYQIRFKKTFMHWLLLAYMLPEFLFVLPMYSIYQTMGLYDTHFGLALMYQVHALPFSIWMLRSFLEEIPKEIDDAALIDGCSPLQMIYKIYIPLILPGIVATAILNGIWMAMD